MGSHGLLPFLFVSVLCGISIIRSSIPATEKYLTPFPESFNDPTILTNLTTSLDDANYVVGLKESSSVASNTTIKGNGKGNKKQRRQRKQKYPRPTKFFAIHIGPSKTGTSAIQQSLAQNPFGPNTLAQDKDKLIYVGKRYGHDWPDPHKKDTIRKIKRRKVMAKKERMLFINIMDCMKRVLVNHHNSTNEPRAVFDERLETDQTLRATLKKSFLETCWANTEYVEKDYMLDYSIVDSNENFSFGNIKETHVFAKQSDEIATRFRIFDILGYDKLLLVGTYRRYAEWLVSVYTQVVKTPHLYDNLEGKQMSESCPTIMEYLEQHLRGTGFSLQSYNNIDITLPKITSAGPNKLETRTLNFFQLSHVDSKKAATNGVQVYHSITTELFCDAFGMELMPHTCEYSRSIDGETDVENASSSLIEKTNSTSLVANKGSTSNSIYQQITAAAYQRGFLISAEEQSENDQKSSKVTNWKELSNYHTKVHKKNWVTSLPIVCPPRNTLEQLLERSLEFEKLVMPQFYNTPLGKEEHERLFWDVWLKEKKLFCGVDIERLYQNATTWDEIINERMVNYDWG